MFSPSFATPPAPSALAPAPATPAAAFAASAAASAASSASAWLNTWVMKNITLAFKYTKMATFTTIKKAYNNIVLKIVSRSFTEFTSAATSASSSTSSSSSSSFVP